MSVALRTFASTSKTGWCRLFIQQTVRMSTDNFRIERDTFGELKFFFTFFKKFKFYRVPNDRYYGAQTARFPFLLKFF
jgi:hypothetical protein